MLKGSWGAFSAAAAGDIIKAQQRKQTRPAVKILRFLIIIPP